MADIKRYRPKNAFQSKKKDIQEQVKRGIIRSELHPADRGPIYWAKSKEPMREAFPHHQAFEANTSDLSSDQE
jgi:hypothetical protein